MSTPTWFRLPLAALALSACGSAEPTQQAITVTVLDSAGAPVQDAYVGLYEDFTGPFFYSSEHDGSTDAQGTVVINVPAGESGRWYPYAVRVAAPRLDSLAAGRVLQAMDPASTSTTSLVMSPLEPGSQSIPGSWTRMEGGGPTQIQLRQDGTFHETFADGSTEVGTWTYDGDVQGTLSMKPTGYVAAELFVMAVTPRYLALMFNGGMWLYEK